MKKEDLVIGKKYKLNCGEITQFDGFISKGKLVRLIPERMDGWMLYNKKHELFDPEKKSGTFSLGIDKFLNNLKEVN